MKGNEDNVSRDEMSEFKFISTPVSSQIVEDKEQKVKEKSQLLIFNDIGTSRMQGVIYQINIQSREVSQQEKKTLLSMLKLDFPQAKRRDIHINQLIEIY
ncbi:CLUMA_CG016858, isoform A [Clunio marinus]|uniref:CLUMA_CG016858, isoform A n=1 Tax=Clunio marinus TaxID=568069 RepID=A0A1J1ITY7_9DIPT|nr:CLUMA_CG016858, isoform A [Clunio marinus]